VCSDEFHQADELTLLDDLLISNIGSGRDVISLGERMPQASGPAVLTCGPDLDRRAIGE
jgi:hypothetical protein